MAFKNLLSNQEGTTAIQYALVAGILSLAVLVGSLAMRGSIVDLYDGMAVQANAALQVQPAAGPLPERAGGDD